MENGKESFIAKYWTNLVWIIGVVFISGGAWSEFKMLNRENVEIRKELEELKEQVFKEIEQRVDDLEEKEAYRQGKSDAEKEFKVTIKSIK